ncbi:MAG: dockerin type I repeat-containing protein [Bacteroidaceae bacterium]|nr:dockerin type I repeat-containing protein [Bacteroidaceae bacterium]
MKLNKHLLATLNAAWLTLSVTAQTLSVAPVEADLGGKTELVVSGSSISAMTALQFNLTFPEGVTLDETKITKSSRVSGHELVTRTLADGSRLFVLYNMNKALLADGELLRLPVSVGGETGTLEGGLTKVRTATTEAVSHAAGDVAFTVTIKAEEQPVIGDVNGDGKVDISDYIGIANHILGNTPEGFNAIAADVNDDGQIDISDYIGVANIILTGSLTGK